MISPPLLQIDQALCRVNRQSVLDIESFAILPGQHWCVFGPNGAGKSLLTSLLAGKRRESGSYVSFAADFDPARDCLFVSFEEQQRLWQQDNRLDMSEYSERAEDKGTLVADLIASSRSKSLQDQALLQALLVQLELEPVLEKGIRFLSSGQIRKVLLARALYAAHANAGKLVIFDDPLESIDRNSRHRISECIHQQRQSGFSSLALCRRQQDILPATTHLALMDGLQIIAQGPLEDIIDSAEFHALANAKPDIPTSLPPAPKQAHAEVGSGPLIQLQQVNASYGELAVLSEVNWTMQAGDHVLIEGPNGCGKSTLLSLIDGENHKAYGQQVTLFGQRRGSGETVWDVKSRFGIVSNELHNKYVKGWKVLDVVVSGYFDSVGLYDDSGSTEWEGARQWLQCLGIEGLQSHYYHELSFGQQRLVLLARAMVKHPDILILDEPCVGLDDYHRELILGTLSVIAAQTRTQIIYVSHVSDEEPAFFTQKLRFMPAPAGGYTLQQETL